MERWPGWNVSQRLGVFRDDVAAYHHGAAGIGTGESLKRIEILV